MCMYFTAQRIRLWCRSFGPLYCYLCLGKDMGFVQLCHQSATRGWDSSLYSSSEYLCTMDIIFCHMEIIDRNVKALSVQSIGCEAIHLSARPKYPLSCTTIIQQDAALRSKLYFTAALLYMFRVFSTPIIRSTSNVSTASGTGHTSV